MDKGFKNTSSFGENTSYGQNDIVRNLVVGILVIIVLFFIYQSVRGNGSNLSNSKILNQLFNLTKDNNLILYFQKDLIEELTKANEKIKALDEFSIVIDQSINFEGYNGYTGVPYYANFKSYKFPT
jgi:ABC-type uncharacterized transport system substrate-binding protein